MDKVSKYREIILSVLEDYAQLGTPAPGITRQIIADTEKNHYQLVTLGWREGRRFVYIVAFHFDIIGDKIWIQQNNTEAHIADELIARGVEPSDIIIGYQPPSVQSYANAIHP